MRARESRIWQFKVLKADHSEVAYVILPVAIIWSNEGEIEIPDEILK